MGAQNDAAALGSRRHRGHALCVPVSAERKESRRGAYFSWAAIMRCHENAAPAEDRYAEKKARREASVATTRGQAQASSRRRREGLGSGRTEKGRREGRFLCPPRQIFSQKWEPAEKQSASIRLRVSAHKTRVHRRPSNHEIRGCAEALPPRRLRKRSYALFFFSDSGDMTQC